MKYILSFCLLLLFHTSASADLFGDDDLLPADQAFALSSPVIKDGNILLNWKITDGYYLYRSKLAFVSKTEGVSLSEPLYPKGKIKQDEFFGKMEIYRGDIQVSLPTSRSDSSLSKALLQVTSQGCADRGICYPPQKKTVEITFPQQAAAATASTMTGLSSLNKNFGFGADTELLPADEAFRLDAKVIDANTLEASWSIADGYYLYKDKFKFSTDSNNISLQAAKLPAGETKQDEAFGSVEVFHTRTQATIPLNRTSTDSEKINVTFTFQGCEEKLGVCYPPIKKTLSFLIPAAEAATAPTSMNTVADLNTDAGAGTDTAGTAALLSEQDSIAKRLASGNIATTLLAFFGFGLLLAFTPCVFPMIPILSSIIVGEGEQMTTRRGFILSTVYVLAMATTYAAIGVIAGLFGENLQAAFQNPWILSAFAAVFALLSLSMFGFYELQMPSFIQNKLTTISNEQKGGSLAGVAIMGFLSALIVGPCVAAPLAGALIYIGQTGNAVLGGMALFALSLGMGAPLIAIGTGAGKLLPKAGGWMEVIKAVFGVMLLGVAIWMLERILPGAITLLLWAALLIISAIYMGAIEPLSEGASGWKKLWKGTGLMALLYGALLLIGAASGGSDPFRPLANLHAGGGTQQSTQTHMAFKQIKTIDDLERELKLASEQGKPVMLDFYADWCISCKELEKYTFGNADVKQATQHMTLLQADVTDNDETDKALMKHFGIIGPPSIIFYDKQGQKRPELQLVGFKKPGEFIAHIAGL
ncbi:MAG: protein-disulfide reductase DsbD [Gammaproteobacteria bacterium]